MGVSVYKHDSFFERALMSLRGNRNLKKAKHLAVAAAFSFVIATPVAANAQTFVSGSAEVQETTIPTPPDEVLDNNITREQAADTEVLAETAERGLAMTGTDVLALSVIGAGALGAGATALAVRRRRAN